MQKAAQWLSIDLQLLPLQLRQLWPASRPSSSLQVFKVRLLDPSPSTSAVHSPTMLIFFGLIGTSVVQALLKDGTFKPRAVTRSANSDAARSLAALGAEVVEAAFDDKDALQRAVTGAECVFLVSVCLSFDERSSRMLSYRKDLVPLHSSDTDSYA